MSSNSSTVTATPTTTTASPASTTTTASSARPKSATANAAASSSAASKFSRNEHAMNGNQVWVSAQRRVTFSADIALRMFVKHEIVELHGLGAAIAAAVDVSQHLQHIQKATIQRITTGTIASGGAPKPEIVILIKRTGIPDIAEEELIRITEDEDKHVGDE